MRIEIIARIIVGGLHIVSKIATKDNLTNKITMKFECSRNENECDKGIKWIDSCRECIFNVLCKLDKNGQTLFFNKGKGGK